MVVPCGSCSPTRRGSAGSTARGHAGRRQTRGRFPTRSRVHLSVRCGLPQGRGVRLFGHADVEHGMLPGFPRLPFTKIRPVPYSSGSRRGSRPPVSRPRAPRQHLAAIPSALLAGAQPEGKCLARNPREDFKNYALKSIDAVRAKLEQAILYLEHNPDIVKSITGFPYIIKSL